ncbi:MAG: tetratricopeptide repeat protein [Alphaproteobacteria bacterium]|nr:tetratricopeptide repeat protein [Alphaproteobacteria bacterium]
MTHAAPPDAAGPSHLAEAVDALRRGAWPAARRAARRMLAADPGGWSGWHLVSLASASSAGVPPLPSFRRAVWLAPDRHELWGSLAAACESAQRHPEATAAARRSLSLAPFAAEAAANLGVSLRAAGSVGPAARWLDRAAALTPGNPVVLNSRAALHLAAGEDGRAAALLHQALAAAPGYADARLNLAIVERRLGRPGVAVSAVMGAVRAGPADSDYLAELGTVLVTAGEARSGIAWLRRALASRPSNERAASSLLGAFAYAPDVSEDERRRAYGAAASQVESTASSPRPFSPGLGRRLVVGYVSPSLHSHPMAWQLVELFAHHRRDRVEVVVYADLRRRDAMTDRLAGFVDTWRETTCLDDGRTADLIRSDGVDVLVFLALHEEHARRGLPAHRSAPVQISLYDIATSGLSSLDAWITDPLLHPTDTTEWFSEPLMRIPSLFLYSGLHDDPPIEPRPVDGPVTFASFNNPAKLSEPTLRVWANILHSVPGSTLALRYGALFDDPIVAGRVRHFLGNFGIPPDRLRLSAGSLPRAGHLRSVGAVDIALDPFPYNGNTATIEALWMGVPVVALRGARFLGRMSASILERIGRGDCVAGDAETYVDLARTLALDAGRRQHLRRSLREDIRRSALFDAAAYAAAMEDAFFRVAEQKRGGIGVTSQARPPPTLEDAVRRHRGGDLPGALDAYARLACVNPAEGLLVHLVGVSLHQLGHSAAGLRWLLRATALADADALLLHNLGEAARASGDVGRADRAYRGALRRTPDFVESRSSHAMLLRETGRFAEADLQSRRALVLAPDNARAHIANGLTAESARGFARAVAIDPADAGAWSNLGAMFLRDGWFGRSAAAMRRALALLPANGETWVNFGSVVLGRGQAAVALVRQRRGLALRPSPELHSNILFTMLSVPAAADPTLLCEARRWERRYTHPSAVRPSARAGADRPLVLGYLSADFRRHPIAGNVEELLRRHDRRRFTVNCYVEVGAPDPVTGRFRALADRWAPTIGRSDAEVAAQIRADGVDILVVLGGHTASNRLTVAALRAAPVQVSFHAPSTTGLAAIDYWLSDALLTPPGWETRFAERIYRLPAFYTFQAPAGAGPIVERRHGEAVVFGSFNNPSKLNDDVLAAWARILRALPQSYLRLGYHRHFDDPTLRRRVLDAFAEAPAAVGRVEFLPAAADAAEHFGRLGDVDIVLDTFPFGGATSSFEALWMGVPVVTIAGDRFVGRVGASLAPQVGLQDLVAADEGGYVDAAIGLARDEPRRRDLRRTLRDRLLTSPAMAYDAQTRALETAYLDMWRRSAVVVAPQADGRVAEESV